MKVTLVHGINVWEGIFENDHLLFPKSLAIPPNSPSASPISRQRSSTTTTTDEPHIHLPKIQLKSLYPTFVVNHHHDQDHTESPYMNSPYASSSSSSSKSFNETFHLNHVILQLPTAHLSGILPRRWLFVDNIACELFYAFQPSLFLVFGSRQSCQKFIERLLKRCIINNTNHLDDGGGGFSIRIHQKKGRQSFKLTQILKKSFLFNEFPPKLELKNWTEAWQQHRISNFEYLLFLNMMSGRSFNDYGQYPVYPWILQNFTSKTIDLNDPLTFRDLSNPVGALSTKHLSHALNVYNSLNDPDIPKFMYGSHYSSPAAVLFYLLRQEPYVSYHILLQGGKIDHPDRLFYSLPHCWYSVVNHVGDVKELVPEFFMHENFLKCRPDVHLGHRQDGEPILDVKLPPWASSQKDFIKTHIMALESKFVSQKLHAWIDLIWGCKQTGEEAKRAFNVFYFTSYGQNIKWDNMKDLHVRKTTELQVLNFGQTPRQLFQQPHPTRTTNLESISDELFVSLSSLMTSDTPSIQSIYPNLQSRKHRIFLKDVFVQDTTGTCLQDSVYMKQIDNDKSYIALSLKQSCLMMFDLPSITYPTQFVLPTASQSWFTSIPLKSLCFVDDPNQILCSFNSHYGIVVVTEGGHVDLIQLKTKKVISTYYDSASRIVSCLVYKDKFILGCLDGTVSIFEWIKETASNFFNFSSSSAPVVSGWQMIHQCKLLSLMGMAVDESSCLLACIDYKMDQCCISIYILEPPVLNQPYMNDIVYLPLPTIVDLPLKPFDQLSCRVEPHLVKYVSLLINRKNEENNSSGVDEKSLSSSGSGSETSLGETQESKGSPIVSNIEGESNIDLYVTPMQSMTDMLKETSSLSSYPNFKAHSRSDVISHDDNQSPFYQQKIREKKDLLHHDNIPNFIFCMIRPYSMLYVDQQGIHLRKLDSNGNRKLDISAEVMSFANTNDTTGNDKVILFGRCGTCWILDIKQCSLIYRSCFQFQVVTCTILETRLESGHAYSCRCLCDDGKLRCLMFSYS